MDKAHRVLTSLLAVIEAVTGYALNGPHAWQSACLDHMTREVKVR